MWGRGLLAGRILWLDRTREAAADSAHLGLLALRVRRRRHVDRAEVVLARVRDVRERVAVCVLHECDHVIAVELAHVVRRSNDVGFAFVCEPAGILAVRRIHAHVCLVAFMHPVECLALLVRDGFVTNVVRSGRRAAEA